LGLLTVGALAGCSDTSADPTDDSTGDDGDASNGSTATDGESTDGSASSELDLREANVVDVAVSDQNGSYAFDVTLHHDDNGEDGYANWWQVEQPDGTQLGRRDLAHPHSTQPFTRSTTVEIPDAVDCVVVRGHDQTHEYGGQAMLVTLDSGATRAVDQGPEPDSFEDVDCP